MSSKRKQGKPQEAESGGQKMPFSIPGDPKAPARASHYWLLGIFLLSLSVRLAYLNEIKSNPFFKSPIIDAAGYDGNAWSLAQGRETTDKGLAYYQAPLYTCFLSAVYRIAGHSYFTARAVQAVVSSFSCILMFFLGRKLFGRRAGLAAAAIYAVYGPVILYDGELLKPFMVIFLNLAGLLLLLHAGERPHWLRWSAAGAVFGLSCLTRENTLLFLPAAAVWILLINRNSGCFSVRREGLAGAVCFSVAALLVISPAAIRNYRAEKDFVLISKTGGLNFFIGNSPRYDDYLSMQPGHRWQQVSHMPDIRQGRVLKSSERSGFFYREALNTILTHPQEWSRVFIRKVLIFWNGREFDPNFSIEYLKSKSHILRVFMFSAGGCALPFGVVAPLGLVGMLLVFRTGTGGQKKMTLLFLLYTAAYAASVILFLVKARYRLPVVPVLILYSVYGAIWFIKMFREGQYRHAGKYAAFLFLSLVLCNFPFANADSEQYFPLHYYLARTHVKNREYRKAIPEFLAALDKNPDFAEARNELANVYMRTGNLKDAEEQCRRVVRAFPEFSEAQGVMGMIYQKTGRDSLALLAYGTALKHVDKLTDVHGIRTNMGMVLFNLGKFEEAIGVYVPVQKQAPSPKVNRLLGLAYLALGRLKDAEDMLRLAIRAEPHSHTARHYLGVTLEQQGKNEEAMEEYGAAIRIKPEDSASAGRLEQLREKRGSTGHP